MTKIAVGLQNRPNMYKIEVETHSIPQVLHLQDAELQEDGPPSDDLSADLATTI